jgi:hypothetical protein
MYPASRLVGHGIRAAQSRRFKLRKNPGTAGSPLEAMFRERHG